MLAVAIPVGAPGEAASVPARILTAALAAMLLSAAIYALLCLLLQTPIGTRLERRPGGWRSTAACMILCALVWGLYLAAFYPGIMSYDSIDQWRQLMTLELNDHHPVAHTLLNWLVTRLWLSPAAVGVFQILVLSALCGAAVNRLRGQGAPAWLAAGIALFYALYPLNGMYAVTLWKDVPYSAAVFALTMLLAEVVASGGRWLESNRHCALLGAALVAVALLRHNGLLAATVSVIGLVLAFLRHRRRVTAVSLAVAATILLVKFPVYELLGVERERSVADRIQTYQVAAIIASGAELSEEERRVAEAILPLEDWKRYYSPFTLDPLTNSPRFNGRYLWTEENRTQLTRTWVSLAREHPRALLRHLIKNSSLVWRIRQFPDGYTMSMWFAIDPNDYGLVTRPLVPPLHRFLESLTRRVASGPDLVWFFCRPSLFLFVCLFSCALLALRWREGRAVLLVLPVVASAAPFLVFSPCQDTRYMYPVMLAAPFLLARAMLEAGRTGGEGEIDTARSRSV